MSPKNKSKLISVRSRSTGEVTIHRADKFYSSATMTSILRPQPSHRCRRGYSDTQLENYCSVPKPASEISKLRNTWACSENCYIEELVEDYSIADGLAEMGRYKIGWGIITQVMIVFTIRAKGKTSCAAAGKQTITNMAWCTILRLKSCAPSIFS
ncbi:hypothetical protein GQ44DRAFT_731933 [Phaeosphaeriaceae sp. PMI808]|nr:hypothetical protein GQ44DRAFT_731933 [Phaeosphaeriaceae sp. PMI808]